MKKLSRIALIAFALAALPLGAARAVDTSDSVESVRAAVLNLIRGLVDQGVISAAKAQDMLRQAGMDPGLLNTPQASHAAPPAAPEPVKPVVRVPYIPESTMEELREEVRQEITSQARAERWGTPGTLPSWLDRLSLYGDVKVRFQSDRYDQSNSPVQNIDAAYGQPQGTTLDSTDARDRIRTRARIGVNAKVSDTMQAGVRVVTSGTSDPYNPTSEYVDAGQYNLRYGANLDLAYVRWNPLESLSVSGGRVANPYLGSDLVWARDFTFDSGSLALRLPLGRSWTAFTTAGAHWLLSTSVAPGVESRDVWMYAGQTGLEANWQDHSSMQFAAGYFDFERIEGQLNPALPSGNAEFGNTAVPFHKLGNTTFNINFLSNPNASPVYALASKFRLVDVYTRWEWGRFEPWKIGFTGEFVRNVGFRASEISNRIGLAAQALPQDRNGLTGVQRPRVNGYYLALQVGASEFTRAWDWNVFTAIRRLERDAVVAEFTSADYRLGGTDQTARILGFGIGLSSRASLSVRYIAAKSLDLAPRFNVDTWLVDVQAGF